MDGEICEKNSLTNLLVGKLACQLFNKQTCQEKICYFFPSTRENITCQGENLLAWTTLYARTHSTHPGNLISNESVVASLVEREDRDLLGKLALALDRGSAITWRHLAEKLAIPRRVYRNFGASQGSNPALLLLKYVPIFDPELTIGDLKELLTKTSLQEAVAVLSAAGIPGE